MDQASRETRPARGNAALRDVCLRSASCVRGRNSGNKIPLMAETGRERGGNCGELRLLILLNGDAAAVVAVVVVYAPARRGDVWQPSGKIALG